ncbi:MAG: hypothetical protein N2254_09760 [bacterium]|nr:hypothetical protein [bacterium]MDW7973461.1 hypothetical protein [Thermodesulfovibrio sp.]
MVKVEVTEQMKEKLARVLEHHTVRELTSILGISRGTVERILKAQNVRILRRTYGKLKKLLEETQ